MPVGTKEMVHCIFKGIIPHTNKHNLEGLDDQKEQDTIVLIITDPKLKLLLSGWCIYNQNLLMKKV